MNDTPLGEERQRLAAIFEAMAEFYYAIYVIDIRANRFEVLRGTKATAEALLADPAPDHRPKPKA